MDDNQFRRKPESESFAKKKTTKNQDDVIDLYEEFKDPLEGKLDPEVEQLKLLAQSDALRFYGWLRRWLGLIGQRLDKIEAFKPTKRHLKWAKTTVVVLAVGFIGFKVVPNIYNNIKEEQGILGESEAVRPDFNTLSNAQGQQNGFVFDPDANVASFQDTIGGHSVIISQQQMPDTVKADQGGVEKLALSLTDKATINRYETNKGQIYVIAAQNGDQTVIFGHEDLLVFLRMDSRIDDQLWVDFVNGMRFTR